MRTLMLGLTLAAAFVGSAEAQSIQVDVSAKDIYASQVQACLYREFRRNPEVTIVQGADDAGYYVSVIVDRAGGGFGGTLLVTTRLGKELWEGALADDWQEPSVIEMFTRYSLIEQLILFFDTELESLCRRMVSSVEAGPLEAARQVRRRTKEWVEQWKEQKENEQ